MTRIFYGTGNKEAIKPEHAGRRFIAAWAKPSIHSRPLELPHFCDICGHQRNQGNHRRCSKRRQQISRGQQ